MANKSSFKGIQIPIGADTVAFSTAINEVNSALTGTKKELNALQASLKLDFDADKFKQAQVSAQDYLAKTKEKAELLKQAMEQINKEADSPAKAEKIQYLNTELIKVETAGKAVEAQLRTLDKIEFNQMNSQLEATKGKVEALRERLEAKYNNDTFAELQKEAQTQLTQTQAKAEELRKTLETWKTSGVDETSEDFKKLEQQIIETDTEVVKIKESLREINNITFDQVTDAGKALLPVSAAVTAGLVASTKAAIDQESAFTGVRKTVEATEAEYADLKSTLREMSEEIPVATTELMNIAASAGQLGIEKENIAGFTRTIADLGVATNLAGEEAAMTLAKFTNITRMSQDDIGRLGSTIVELGNNSTTTEKDIADMSLRLASAGNQAKMTEADIVSIAASLSSVGLEARAGGSAFSAIINDMTLAVETNSERLTAFAQVAGITAEEFARAYREDAASALLAFIDGLSTAEERGISALEILGNLSIEEKILSDALLRAAGASETFNSTLEMGRQAWEDNIALTVEAEKQYSTTASELQKTKNAIDNAAASLGEVFLPYVKKGAEGVSDLVKWFNSLDDSAKQAVAGIAVFVGALSPALMIVGKVGSGIAGMITTVVELGTAAKGATGIIGGLNAMMAANPAAMVTIAITALVTALGVLAIAASNADNVTKELNQALKDNRQAYEDANTAAENLATTQQADLTLVEKLVPKYEELNGKVNKTTEEKEELRKIVERINGIMPDAIRLINDETGAYETQNGTLKDLIATKRAAIEAELDYQKARNAIVAQREAQEERDAAATKRDDLINQYRENYGDRLTERDLKAIELNEFDFAGHLSSIQKENRAYFSASPETSSYVSSKEIDALKEIVGMGKGIAEFDGRIEEFGQTIDRLLESSAKLGDAIEESGKVVVTANNKTQTAIDQANNRKITGQRAVGERLATHEKDGTQESALALLSGDRTYATDEQKKRIKEIHDYQLSLIENNKARGIISEKEALEQKKVLNEAFYADDVKAKLDADTKYLNDSKNLDKKGKGNGSGGGDGDDDYKELKAITDAKYNALKDHEKDVGEHIQNLKYLQTTYLEEGTKEWYEAQAEINRFEDDIAKKREDGAKQQTKTQEDELKKQEKEKKDFYDNAKLEIEDYKNSVDYTIEGEIAMWEKLGENYTELSKEKVEIDKTLKKLRDELNEETKKSTKETYDDDVEALNQSLKDKTKSYEEFKDEYLKITAEAYGEDSKEYKKATQNILKMSQDRYNQEKQALIWALEDGEISYEEYYERLKQLRIDYADFIEAEENKAIERALDKEIAVAGFGIDLAALEEQYANGEILLTEYLEKSIELLGKHFKEGSLEYDKYFADINQKYERHANKELSDIKKSYNQNLISFDEYKRTYLAKVAELYGEESDIYAQAQADMKQEGIKEYNSRLQDLKDALKLKEITQKEFYAAWLELLKEFFDEESTAYKLQYQGILEEQKAFNDKMIAEAKAAQSALMATPTGLVGGPVGGGGGGGAGGGGGSSVGTPISPYTNQSEAATNYQGTLAEMNDYVARVIAQADADLSTGIITAAQYGRISAQMKNLKTEITKAAQNAGLVTWEGMTSVLGGGDVADYSFYEQFNALAEKLSNEMDYAIEQLDLPKSVLDAIAYKEAKEATMTAVEIAEKALRDAAFEAGFNEPRYTTSQINANQAAKSATDSPFADTAKDNAINMVVTINTQGVTTEQVERAVKAGTTDALRKANLV